MAWLEKIIGFSKDLIYKSLKNSIELQNVSTKKPQTDKSIISQIIFWIYLLNLASILFHKNLDYMKLTINDQIDEIIVSITYYTNIFNIIQDYIMINNIASYLLCLAIFYFSVLCLIILEKILYSSQYLCINYINILNILNTMVCIIEQSYIWLFNLPTANIIALIINHIQCLNTNMLILFIIICIMIVLIHIILYYTRCDLSFISNNPLNVRFGFLLELIIIEHYILSFLIYSTWINIIDEFIPLSCAFFGIIKFYMAWKHLPFTHPIMSKFFLLCSGAFLILSINVLIIHYMNINSNVQYSFTILLMVEIPIVIFALLLLWKKINFNILYSEHEQLSNTLFDFQMRMIIESLKESPKNKKISTLALEIFISNHKNKCSDGLCICKDLTLLKNVDLNKENVLEKSKTILIKKDLILGLISKYIQHKINKSNNIKNNYLKLIYASFLIWWGKDYFKIYQITSSILKSNSSNLQKYNALIIKTNMQIAVTKKRLELNDGLYLIKVIEYYQILNNFKSLIFLFLEIYQQFLKVISNPIIDLNDAIKKGKIVLNQKDQLLKKINTLQKFYETTTEFYLLINLYSQFGFIDQITFILDKHKQEPKILKYSKDSLKDIVDPLDSNSCALVGEFLVDRNMVLSKTTPSFYKIFRYDPQDAGTILISQLMPKVINQYHDKYIRSFTLKSDCFIKYAVVDKLPAIDAQGFVFTAKLKGRYDFFNDRAYLVGLLQKFDHDKEIILVDKSNNILSYSYGLSQILFDLDTLSQLPIALFIPRFLLNLLDNNENRAELYDIYQAKGLFDTLIDFTINMEDDYEFAYLVVPNDINFLLKIKSMITKLNNQSHTDILNLARFMYMNKEETSFCIYKTYINFKEYNFSDKRISLKSLSLSNIKIINNRTILSLINDFVQDLIKFSTVLDNKSTITSKIRLMNNTIPYNNNDLEDLSDENGIASMFPPDYNLEPNPSKTLTFYKLKDKQEQARFLNSRKSLSLKFRQSDAIDNLNYPDCTSIIITPIHNQCNCKSSPLINNILDLNHNLNPSLIFQNNQCENTYNETTDKLNINTQKIITYKSLKNNKNNSDINDDIDGSENNIIISKQNQYIKNYQQKDEYTHDYYGNSSNANNLISKQYTIKQNKRKHIKKNNRSNVSSMSSNTSFKAFIDLLNRKISIKQLDWLHYFGIFIFSTMIVILLSLSLILKSNIDKYTLYVNCSDYPNSMLASIAIYGQYLLQNDLIDHGLINPSNENLTLLSSSILNKMYDEYKNSFENAIFKQQVFDKAYTLYFEDYEMNIMLYEYSDTEISIKTPYFYAVSYLMDTLYQVKQASLTTDRDPYLYFIVRNFPEYFNILMENTWDIGNEAYGNDSRIDVESFAINMLIYCLISTFSFVLLIYPIFYSIETKKRQGISLISTISTPEIMKISTMLEEFLDYSNEGAIIKRQQEILKKKKCMINTFKSIRQWQFKRFNCILFIAILALFYGIWSTFFAIHTATVIRQNISFKEYYYEYDFITDVLSTTNIEFFMSWLAIHTPGHDDNRDFYLKNYQLPKSIFTDRLNTFVSFWINIDEFISNNTQMTDFYSNTHLYIKEQDLCLYINSYLEGENDLKKCQTALNGAMKNGILKTMLMLSESLVDRIRIPLEQELDESKIIDMLNSPIFKGVADIQKYFIYFFQQYIFDVKLNLNMVLNSNLKSLDFFLGSGIFMFIGSFWIFWMPFVYYLRKELDYVKKIYCCLPASIIIQNPYVKKWLNDNSVNL